MARETKVGLLAGLAFIITFAFILSHRERAATSAPFEPFLPPETGPSVGGVAPVPFEPKRSAGPKDDRNPREIPVPQHGRLEDRVVAGQGQFPGAGDANLASSGAEIQWPGLAASNVRPKAGLDGPTNSILASNSFQQNGERGQAVAPSHRKALEELLAKSDGENEIQRTSLQDSPATSSPSQLETGSQRAGPEVQTPAAPPTEKSAGAKTGASGSHKVASGDTLSTIAKAHYGPQGARFVDAIFKANRAILSDPDRLLPGMVLKLPPRGGVVEQSASAPDTSRRSPPTAAPSRAPFRWYQIREGDRYASIARNELGDVDRWHEIYELNKDRFPVADRIRPGVRIRIPRGGPMVAAEARR